MQEASSPVAVCTLARNSFQIGRGLTSAPHVISQSIPVPGTLTCCVASARAEPRATSGRLPCCLPTLSSAHLFPAVSSRRPTWDLLQLFPLFQPWPSGPLLLTSSACFSFCWLVVSDWSSEPHSCHDGVQLCPLVKGPPSWAC